MATAAQLTAGQEVELEVRGEPGPFRGATSQEREVTGTIRPLAFTPRPTLTLQLEGGGEGVYAVADNAVVERNERTATLSDLRAGHRARVLLRGGKVARIDADSKPFKAYGTVKTLTIAERGSITIRTEAEVDQTYPLARGLMVCKGSASMEQAQVRVGYYVERELQSGEVTPMDVQPRQTLDTVSGTIAYNNTRPA